MKRIFFILWGNPKFYQTLIFLAENLSNKGFEVFILSRNSRSQKDIIKKVNFGRKTKILESPSIFTGTFNLADYFMFIIFVFFKTFSLKPQNLIFFNKKALFCSMFLKLFKNKNIKFTYHNFDFELLKNSKNLKEKLLTKLEFSCSKICDNLIFPSLERSKIFVKHSKNNLSKTFHFMNCFPKKKRIIFNKKFKHFLNKKKFKKKIICHLGSIGPDHYLEEIIKSIKFLDKKFILIIGGISIGNYSYKLMEEIKKNDLEDNVFIFQNITNEFWFDILNNSDLGLCFYKQTVLSHKFMAGTSQKFNNYLYFKIPMLVNNNFDFTNFKKKYDLFNITDPSKPKKLAASINNIFKNKKRYNQIKINMKKAFKEKLNFDYQYENSYKKILDFSDV